MPSKPTKIIGLAGGSCSGKTELERNLQARLGNQLSIFPFDDMFVGMSALEGNRIDDWESPALYRWDELFDALNTLRQGHAATFSAHSRESAEAGIRTRTIEPRRVVIVAGFLALHDEAIRSLYDDTVYIDLPEDEIIRRRKERAKPDSPWDTDEYINSGLIPGHRRFVIPQREVAKHIISGLQSREALADEVVMVINSPPGTPTVSHHD
jgi:uridine kinase